jgi:hypothetical protein
MGGKFRRVVDAVLFPYWWIAGLIRLFGAGKQNVATDRYLRRRQSLLHAKVTEDGRIVGPLQAVVDDPARALEWLHRQAAALVARASALMTLNGVMLAAAAFLLSIASAGGTSALQVDAGYVMWVAALSSISILFCLFVVSIDWPSLGRIEETPDGLDFTTEFEHLCRAARLKECAYRLAWVVSFVATLLFIWGFARQLRM